MSFQPQTSRAWVCAQIGAREHFAIARALQAEGRLEKLYTDFWAGPVFRKLAPAKLRPLTTRFHPELAESPVKSWNIKALGWELLLRRKFSGNLPSAVGRSSYDGFIEVGRRFATCVRGDLKRRRNLPPGSIFFAYDTGALEAMEWCRGRNIKRILNQMDPSRVEVELVRAEEKQWPGWALKTIQVPEAYFVRREQEWALADRVVVNSEFSRLALLQQGVPSEKLVVVPLCYEAEVESGKQIIAGDNDPSPTALNFSAASPLRVLFLGQVILRKGIQYLMAAARELEGEPIHFDVVGSVGISAAAVASAPRNLTFHGRTGREGAAAWYQRSQVFVLPTISDGFALTQLEAMSHGLPVVATPNCGAVVSDGTDGFIVPARKVEALVKIFRRYLSEPKLLVEQQAAARIKARQFTLQHLAKNLRALEQSF